MGLIISFLMAYVLIRTSLTGEPRPFVVLLLLALATQVLVCRFRYGSLEIGSSLGRMYAALRGARERITQVIDSRMISRKAYAAGVYEARKS